MIRLATVLVVAAATLTSAGCFEKEEFVTVGETEGIYVTVDELKYQIQISRILDPASPEDRAYLRGLPAGEEDLPEDAVWFGIFMRVENNGEEPGMAADEFRILDTQDNEFEPVELESESNAFLYEAAEVLPGEVVPGDNLPPADNTIQGSLILFEIETDSLYNRPLELEIVSPSGGEDGIIDLDV